MVAASSNSICSAGDKTLEHFGHFTSGGQINSLKQKLCKHIYFECKFNSNMLENKFL